MFSQNNRISLENKKKDKNGPFHIDLEKKANNENQILRNKLEKLELKVKQNSNKFKPFGGTAAVDHLYEHKSPLPRSSEIKPGKSQIFLTAPYERTHVL